MRSLLTLFACLILVVAAWSGAALAADIGCSEMADQTAPHIAGDCDEVPADADRGYPHCHTGCHGQHVAAPIPFRAAVRIADLSRDYSVAARMTLTANRVDPALRPPQA